MTLIKQIMATFNDNTLFADCHSFKFKLIDKELKVVILFDNKGKEIGKIELRIKENSCRIIYKGLSSFVLKNNDSYEIVKTVFKKCQIHINYELHGKILKLNSLQDLNEC